MESFEKFQARFPLVKSWEETGRFTRKGHRIVEGRIEITDEYWVPDTYGNDGNWEFTSGLDIITAVVDVKTNQVYTHSVEMLG